MEHQADEAGSVSLGSTAVDAHPNADPVTRRPAMSGQLALRLHGRLHGRRRIVEDEILGVALGAEDLAVVGLRGRGDDAVMGPQHSRVVRAQLA